MELRYRSYLGEAKKMTFAQAKEKILDMLEDKGWRVNRHLKIPHATKGDVKVWFKKQAIYCSPAPLAFNAARSLHLDTKFLATMDPDKLDRGLERRCQKFVDDLY